MKHLVGRRRKHVCLFACLFVTRVQEIANFYMDQQQEGSMLIGNLPHVPRIVLYVWHWYLRCVGVIQVGQCMQAVCPSCMSYTVISQCRV